MTLNNIQSEHINFTDSSNKRKNESFYDKNLFDYHVDKDQTIKDCFISNIWRRGEGEKKFDAY